MHTPGPWNAPETNQINYMGDTYTVDVVYQRDLFDKVPLAFVAINNPEESVANAALIAAAPELLEALKAMLRPHTCGAECDRAMKCMRNERAWDAIAKAEGR